MSHGARYSLNTKIDDEFKEETIATADDPITIRKIVQYFTKNISLGGVPKLFFVQVSLIKHLI